MPDFDPESEVSMPEPKQTPARPLVVLRNDVAQAAWDLGGGSLTEFRLAYSINPLAWLAPEDRNAPLRPSAHFLCLDRWGQPSPGEQAVGIPFHGEATRVPWRNEGSSQTEATMSATLPEAGLEIRRKAVLTTGSAVLRVEETVRNVRKTSKIYNMVQHPTLGPPFLTPETRVDSNAARGISQHSPLPDPERILMRWPDGIHQGRKSDLRHLIDDPMPAVTSFVVDEPIGWVTASTPQHGLLLGYFWKTEDYPWFNCWRHVDEANKPMARGLEFGTTGLHQPFDVLTAKGSILGRRLTAFLDAGASTTRHYTAFLIPIPANWRGTGRVDVGAGRIQIRETGRRPLTIELTDQVRG